MTETKRRPGGADLRELVDFEGTCLTIYLSGHKAGSGSGSQRMRLLAKLSEAERELATRGVTAATADALVEPLRELVDDPDLGYGHDDSLAIFRSSRQLKQWRLPWNVEDELSVGAYPLLMPIASGLHANPDFLILALSRQNTRMLRCGPGFQHAVEWPMDLPRGLREFEGFDRPDHARANGRGSEVRARHVRREAAAIPSRFFPRARAWFAPDAEAGRIAVGAGGRGRRVGCLPFHQRLSTLGAAKHRRQSGRRVHRRGTGGKGTRRDAGMAFAGSAAGG